jgi:ribosomal protein S18 acetylase RimI-like enzyme
MFEVIPVQSGVNLETVRTLFREYAASLNFNLCFQGFEDELRSLPGPYALPEGRLLLALEDDRPAGCIAFKRLEGGICEMKRLYVRPQFRGRGLGRTLAELLVSEARTAGYELMRLDTIADILPEAMALYRSMGFYAIPPYYDNPIPGAAFLQLEL